MLTFFLTILIVYIFWFVARPWIQRYARRKFQEKINDFFTNAYGAPGNYGAPRDDRRPGTSTSRPRRRKIFAADEGEYVEFQETIIEVSAETQTEYTDSSRAHTPAEPRISDAEWEEL